MESDEHNEATEHNEAVEHSERTEAPDSGETAFGINLESTPVVVLAVVVSVVLAIATWRTDKLILLVTALFAAAFALLDVAEFSHQIKESATTIAVIAAIIAVLHTATALLAKQRRAAAP